MTINLLCAGDVRQGILNILSRPPHNLEFSRLA
jgi:hypothetical protein